MRALERAPPSLWGRRASTLAVVGGAHQRIELRAHQDADDVVAQPVRRQLARLAIERDEVAVGAAARREILEHAPYERLVGAGGEVRRIGASDRKLHR